MRLALASLLIALSVVACAEGPTVPVAQTVGPNPTLPAPRSGLIPTLNTPKAGGWAPGEAPLAPAGFTINRFAEGMDHPRWVYRLSNGDVLVALSSTEPSKPKGLKAWVMQQVQKHVGALEKSPNQIVFLRDADHDGVAETRTVLIGQGLNQPFGLALLGGSLYVADTDQVLRFPYDLAAGRVTGPAERVVDLPHGPRHWTRNLLVAPDGKSLFVSVGSGSNVAEGGMAQEEGRAAIWLIDPATKTKRLLATGLRNPNGFGLEPTNHALWTVVNERDEIGDDLVPDYLTSVRDGDNFGWPWFYWGGHRDTRVKDPPGSAPQPGRAPDYALGSHVAALGLAFYDAVAFPTPYRGGAFIGEHGSWNRSQLSGYKVVFVPFAGGAPAGPPQDFLTGFLDGDSRTHGRPVGVAVGADGALLVADDVGGVIWRVVSAG